MRAVIASIETTGTTELSSVRNDAFLLEAEPEVPELGDVELPVELLELELPAGEVLDGVAAAPGAVTEAKLGGVAKWYRYIRCPNTEIYIDTYCHSVSERKAGMRQRPGSDLRYSRG